MAAVHLDSSGCCRGHGRKQTSGPRIVFERRHSSKEKKEDCWGSTPSGSGQRGEFVHVKTCRSRVGLTRPGKGESLAIVGNQSRAQLWLIGL